MFHVNQRVKITAPTALRLIQLQNTSPTGTIIAIVPDSRYPVKVLLDEGKPFSIPFCFNGEVCDYNFSFTLDGMLTHSDLKPGLEVVNV